MLYLTFQPDRRNTPQAIPCSCIDQLNIRSSFRSRGGETGPQRMRQGWVPSSATLSGSQLEGVSVMVLGPGPVRALELEWDLERARS